MPQNYKPYKNKELDGRFKIMPEQYADIIAEYRWVKSSRALAKKYDVNKGTILKIVSPNYAETQKRYSKGRWAIYYDRKKFAKAMKKYRDKKRELKLAFSPKPKLK